MKRLLLALPKRFTVIVITMYFAINSTVAAQTQCLNESESAAEKIRRLQTTLMVGALQCRNASNLNLTGNYNIFIQRHGAIVSAYNQTLKGYFQRAIGKKYQRAMDRHITSLANSISSKAYKDRDFCFKVAELGLKALNPGGKTLEQIAATNSVINSTLQQCPSNRHIEASNQN
ncbi:MAG: hypothetical protein PVF65_05560 [Sphingomonadales bacterium]|jgi:hypothetical protein